MSADVRLEKYLKKLVGWKEVEDALKRLDKLTQEEARMAAAEILKLTHIVDDKVTTVINGASSNLTTGAFYPKRVHIGQTERKPSKWFKNWHTV